MTRRLLLAFFLSGMTGILFQVVAFKMLGLVMGNSVYSLTAVVTSFMTGLALGSLAAGRILGRASPLKVYGLLEAMVGLYVLAFPHLLAAAGPWLQSAYRDHSGDFQILSLIRFGISFGLLALPTLMMGATLPILVQALTRDEAELGSQVGRLYAINSAGAVFGALGASFLCLPVAGISGTLALIAVIDLGIGWMAVRLAGSDEIETPVTRESSRRPVRPPAPGLAWRAGAVLLLGGFAALGFELVWTRALILIVGTSTYAFSMILATFIGGIAAGSALASRWAARVEAGAWPAGARPAWGDPGKVLFGLQATIGALGVLSLPLIGYLPLVQIDLFLDFNANWWILEATQLLLIATVTFFPAALMGACLPVAIHLVPVFRDRIAARVGTIYGAATVGNIAGSFATGALIIPALGLERTTFALSMVEAGAAALAARWFFPAGRRVVPVTVALVVPLALYGLLPGWNLRLLHSGPYVYAGIYHRDARSRGVGYLEAIEDNYQVLFHREGVSATVAVTEAPSGHRGLCINGKTDASSYQDMKTQRLVGHLPLMLHPDPRDVLVVGLGSGVTLSSVLAHPVERVRLVEISPEVLEAAPYFTSVNYACLEDRRVVTTVGDARNHVSHTDETYDVIVSEPTNPWIAGVGNLFTREYFEKCKERLRPGGLTVAWLQAYSMSAGDFRSVVATFRSVFPDAGLWRSTRMIDYMLIGGNGPAVPRMERIASKFQDSRIMQDMVEIGIDDPLDLFSHYMNHGPGLARFAGAAELVTDDNLLLELSAPRNLYAPADPARDVAERARRDYTEILALAGVPEKERGELVRRIGARDVAQRAVSHIKAGQIKPGLAAIDQARALGIDPRGMNKVIQMAYTTLAASLVREGRQTEALEWLGKVLEATTDQPTIQADILNEIGNLHSQSGDPGQAAGSYERALERDPSHIPAQVNLAMMKVRSGAFDEAIRLYERALVVRPFESKILGNLALLYERTDDLGKAAELYDRAVRADPANERSRTNLEAVREQLRIIAAASGEPMGGA